MTLPSELDSQLVRLFRIAARVLAAAVAALGLAICVGRITEIEFLSTVSGGTGVNFLLTGLAALLILSGSRPASRAGRCIAASAVLLSTANMSQWFLHINIVRVASEILPEEARTLLVQSQNDSVQMALIAVSLLLFQMPRRGDSTRLSFADPPMILASLISLMTLLGLIFGVPNFCLFVSCLRISWLGGIGFAVLCLALVLGATDNGLFTMLSRKDGGGVLARRLLPSVVILPLVLGYLRMQGQSAKAFDGETGLAIMIVAMITLTVGIIWWTSWSLGQADLARQMALANLEQSEKRARMIVEQAIDAFIAIDSRGTIRDWNFKAIETFGWSRDEAIGRTPLNTFVPDDVPQLTALLARTESTAPNKPIETVMLHKLGHRFSTELSLFTVTVDNEEIRCAFVRDITERIELEQRLRDFYSTVAHELRSPLTSIRCCLSMVREHDADLPDTLKEGIVVADSSVGRLMRLINDLLDVKRIEEGKLELELHPLDSLSVIMQAADELRGMACASHIELIPVVERECAVLADEDRVMQVFTNLISNAIKYSPQGGNVIIKTEAGQEGFLRFSVIDNGPGIPSDQLHKLFTRFGQAGRPESKRVASSGLGLVISRSIVEQHGGKIGLDTTPGKGSKFWFDLPIAPAQPVIAAAPVATGA